MERVEYTPRPDWQRKIQQTGLVYSRSHREDGTEVEYWNDGAAYVFTLPEVEALEQQTEELHRMCLEAARYMASGELGTLGLTRDGFELAAWSLEQGEPDVYARFDLAYAGDGSPAKLLEYNGDTPTGLIEASVTQWHWMRERVESGELPADTDQWNGIHEALVARWRTLLHDSLRAEDGGRLFVAHSDLDTAGEDWDTVAYMRDLAGEAGWEHTGIEMKDIGWHGVARQFVGNQEPSGSARSVFTLPGDEPGTQWPVIRNLFKLYPWEDLVSGEDRATGDQEFGAFLVRDRGRLGRWYEPAWKMFLSNKLLLVALWRLFPGHQNLLPSYADGPNGMTDFVVKPVFGREGDGIAVHRADGSVTSNGSEYRRAGTAGERVWQQYHELPDFPGSNRHNHPVLGSWVVDGESFGVGIRESDGPITDYWCRFAPNIIAPGHRVQASGTRYRHPMALGWKLHGDGATVSSSTIVAPDERLSWGRTIGLGVQHVVAMFGATFLVPLITGFPPSTTLLFSGIGTILFLLITGNRLPSYLGSSFAFLAPIGAATKIGGIPLALSGIIVVGVLLAIVGAIVHLAGAGWIDRLMPPVVSGAIVALIGFNLAPAARDNFTRAPVVALITLAAIILVTVLFKGLVGRLSIVIGVAVGYGAALVGGQVDLSKVGEAAWIGLPTFTAPAFDAGQLAVYLGFVPVVLALVAENVGHVKGVGQLTGRDLTPLTGRALFADGVSTVLAGAGGGSATTTYGENIGVMAATRVFSTAAYWVAAIVAILLGLSPKVGMIISSVPAGVLGGATTALYGLIGVIGIRIWVENRVDFAKPKNQLTAGIALIMGIADFTFSFGGATFGGIIVGTIAAIVVYHLMDLVGRARGTDPATPEASEQAHAATGAVPAEPRAD